MKELSETCTEVENSLPLWVGGDLEPGAQGDVDAHLARCARCAEKAKTARTSRERLLRGLELEQRTVGAGPDPWPAIRAALVAEGRLAGGVRVGAVRRPRGLPIRAAAAAGVVFALAFAWTRFSGAPSNPTTQTAGSLSAIDRGPVPVPTQVDVVPAVAGSGLRRLNPGERQLRDSAQFFDPVIYGKGTGSPVGSPVGLQGAPAVPPR